MGKTVRFEERPFQRERRIIVDRVEVTEEPDDLTQVRIEIAYRLARTGVPQQIGMTMTLEG